MCFKFGIICVVVCLGRVGLDGLEFFGIKDFCLLKGLSREVVFFVVFVFKVVFCDDKFGVLRKFLFFSIIGEIEFFFFIFGLSLIIVDFC